MANFYLPTYLLFDGQYLHLMSSLSVISASFLSLFKTKTFHDFPGFVIQKSITMLSIHMFTEVIGNPLSTL